MGKPAEGEAEMRKALALRQKLSDDNPKGPQFRYHVATTYGNLGYLLRKTGKPAEAEAELRKNLALEQKLVDDNPKVPDYRSEVALALKNLGDVARMLGRNAEARDDYERAIALLDRLVAENSATALYSSHLAWIRGRALARRAVGDAAGAAADARRALSLLEGLPSQSGEDSFEEGCCHALLAGLAGQNGAGVSAAEREAETAQAMALLGKTVGVGYGDAFAFRTDPALDPLHNRPDFQILMMDLTFPAEPFARGE
jgi:tetratricopeptide (TPR) repeat protein